MERLAQLTSQNKPASSSIPDSTTFNVPSATSTASSESKKFKTALRTPDTTSKQGPSRNLLEESKIQNYLDHIAQTSNSVTLADLTRLRPNGYSDPETPEYEEEYDSLVDRLCRSFSKKQLYSFLKMLEIEGSRRKSTKTHYAVQIVEDGWGWPSLAKVKARKRDWSEVLSQDGANLHALSNKYNIHIGFTTRPLSLNAEGLRGALKQLEEHIAFVKEDIVQEYHEFASEIPIPPELLHRISRLSGAFTESFGEGQIRISYRKGDPRAAFIAKRLVTHVLCDLESQTGSSILAHIPPEAPLSMPIPLAMFPFSYALYPFLSSRSLPWNINANGAFRARKVAEWIGINSMEDVQKSGGLELGRGQIIDMEENGADVRQQLFAHLPHSSEGRSKVISASFGHVLLTPPPSTHASLIPPLQGSWPLSNLLKWIRERHIGRLFTPSLPVPVLQSAPQKTQLLHRLIYEARPSGNTPQATNILEFEMVLPSATINQDGVAELEKSNVNPETSSTSATETSHFNMSVNHSCRIGSQFIIDLMLPDRPMDIRFSIFDSVVLSEKLWPAGLQKYFKDLSFFFYDGEPDALPPNAPITMHLQDVEYRLRSSVSVRRAQAHTSAPHLETIIPAITESILDLEVDDKSTLCKITCDDPSSDDTWRAFLKGCDFLGGMRVPDSKKTFIDADTDITL
ncbi:hypothetical protein J3R30DRAFT_3697765 [Lentinula aciculospora]|uniref:Mediator of RNA polymerase II transcription subunit 1 n=1 Tax=Lentinula aciculospora TaxID=153920 RepID=A0A9W9AQS1_9AGAR|nr:hypothetical protein J3R30DRAFT_3697765 [Lentinula aciculospora]